MRQQCHHSSFWHGRRVFKQSDYYSDLWITVGISTATQLIQIPPGMMKLPESSSSSSKMASASSSRLLWMKPPLLNKPCLSKTPEEKPIPARDLLCFNSIICPKPAVAPCSMANFASFVFHGNIFVHCIHIFHLFFYWVYCRFFFKTSGIINILLYGKKNSIFCIAFWYFCSVTKQNSSYFWKIYWINETKKVRGCNV